MLKKQRKNLNPSATLQVQDLHVYYGQSHALQGVNFTLDTGVHSVVGRNGMGKTTLCNTIMGLLPARSGSIRFLGEEISNQPAYKIASMGIGYTPQGRRLWPSLSVHEHLKLFETNSGSWSIDRIYDTFPRLFERRNNGGNQLSGGEQQMLAISRALLQDPQLLVLDEPTEGLAPVIVDQVENLLADLATSSDVSVLLIEQNISVATSISKDVAIMVNGRINRIMPSKQLAADRSLQESLLGVGRHSHDEVIEIPTSVTDIEEQPAQVQHPDKKEPLETELDRPKNENTRQKVYIPPTRWSSSYWKETSSPAVSSSQDNISRPFDQKPEPLFKEKPTSADNLFGDEVYVVGTFDTKQNELLYIRNCIRACGIKTRTIDLSTSGKVSSADVTPQIIASYHKGGSNAVFNGDRGSSVSAMSEAFVNWIVRQNGIGGIISAGGSGGTALATPAMQALPIGLPKFMISTVASGEVGSYVGPTDIIMMNPVTDVQGLNQISKQVLANGAHAIAGMAKQAQSIRREISANDDKPSLGMTMFGVTTTAIQQVSAQLESEYECLVFHATGVGGRSMEKLADSGMLEAAIDLTTTEVCDMFVGGVFPSTEDRFGAFIRTGIPYVGSVGALDMVNFGPRNTVPEKFSNRVFVEHNAQVTLMRTTADENRQMGKWIASRLNEMPGPVRFLLPEGGVSALDAPGQPFHDTAASEALFNSVKQTFKETPTRRLISTPYHINDPAFAAAVVTALEEISPHKRSKEHAAF